VSSGPAGYLHGYARISGIGTLRNLAGEFTSAQGLVAQAHQLLAERVQQAAADNLRGNILRRSVSTDRLAQAILDPKDIFATRFNWGAGSIAWLDNSPAKYWRTQEEGSAAVWSHPFTGTVLKGTWGGSISGFYSNRWGLVPKGGSPIGTEVYGKFIPYYRGMTADLGGGGTRRRGVRKLPLSRKFVVGHEIEPKLFFLKAFEGIGGIAGVQQVYREVFRAAGLPDPVFR